MLENGELLENSESLLVSLAGGPDLTMAEVNQVMKEINHRSENARVIFGALIDDSFANRLAVTLIASGKIQREEKNVSSIKNSRTTNSSAPSETDSQLLNPSSTSRPPSRIVAPAPEMSEEKKGELLTRQSGSRQKKSGPRMRQNEFQLEIVSKGRFEKSEPTIHRGEDLDLPTYIRRGIAFN
jgi:cell division protein FtsZ